MYTAKARVNRCSVSRQFKLDRVLERRVTRDVDAGTWQLWFRSPQLSLEMRSRTWAEPDRSTIRTVNRGAFLQDPTIRLRRSRPAPFERTALTQTDLYCHRYARSPGRFDAQSEALARLLHERSLFQAADLRRLTPAAHCFPIGWSHTLGWIERLIVRRLKRLPQPVARTILASGMRDELPFAEKRSREAHRLNHCAAVAKTQKTAVAGENHGG